MTVRPRAKASEPEDYVVAVASWDLSWSFSAGDPKHDPDPYREFSTLLLRGPVHRPASFRYPLAEITVSGQADLLIKARDQPARSTIGYLQGNNEVLQAYVQVPLERLAMLVAGAPRFRLAVVSGSKLFRRRSSIRGIQLDTEFKPEDW